MDSSVNNLHVGSTTFITDFYIGIETFSLNPIILMKFVKELLSENCNTKAVV